MSRSPTYYDRPVLKEPVWIWTVPVYMFVAGAGGAAAVLAAVARSSGRGELRELVRWARWLAAAGQAAGVPLLIADLGRPARFLNMLRVFRPTSPLNVGSWVLASSAPAAVAAAILGELGRRQELPAGAAGLASGVLGVPLAAYPGVLLAATAVPVWQQSRRSLPVAFVGGAVSSAASVLELLPVGEAGGRVARRYGIAGKLAELGGIAAMRWETSRMPDRVGAPYRKGVSGALLAVSAALTAASLASSLAGRRSRAWPAATGVLGALGSLALRVAVFRAGWPSARDPRATFEQQRAGHGAAEVTGVPGVVGPGAPRATDARGTM